MKQTKFIVLRGPSGSGKSTVSKLLLEGATHKIALIEQDYYRFIFKPAGGGSKPNSDAIHEMIKQNVITALSHGYDVILEGILSVKSYDAVLESIYSVHPNNNFVYYFDISFEETVRRHATRPDKMQQFSATDMEEWYPASKKSRQIHENIIPESYSIEDTLKKILTDTKLING